MTSQGYRQARWEEATVFEISVEGKQGFSLPSLEQSIEDVVGKPEDLVPERLRRNRSPELPHMSEVEVVNHFLRLSQMNYSVNAGRFYPLGSCTMKYNPVLNESVVSDPRLLWAHPYQDPSTVQGILEILYELRTWLLELTGMDELSLEPAAGAHGELLGNLLIRAYHRHNGQLEERPEMIVPDSAHGTNPASSKMAGFDTVTLPSLPDGCLDLEALKSAVSKRTAGLMLTNPNTLGIFESRIEEAAGIVHEAGGLLYYDGANFNAIMGKCRPGDMGFDIVHLNLHKSFSTPHGGGGPGAGPVGVKRFLSEYLPTPVLARRGDSYAWDWSRPRSIGKLRGFYGNIAVLVRAYAYILSLGAKGLEEVAEIAVLNSNYLAKKLSEVRGLALSCDTKRPRKHEFVLTASRMAKETRVTALDLGKKLLDYGVHSPTIYFPLIVEEALMIEPTETAPVEELDEFAQSIKDISEAAYSDPETVKGAPTNTSVRRLDEARAAHPRTFCPSWRRYKRMEEQEIKSLEAAAPKDAR